MDAPPARRFPARPRVPLCLHNSRQRAADASKASAHGPPDREHLYRHGLARSAAARTRGATRSSPGADWDQARDDHRGRGCRQRVHDRAPRHARRSDGKVYANDLYDVQTAMLKILQDKVQRQKLTNVEYVQGTPTDARLPPTGID